VTNYRNSAEHGTAGATVAGGAGGGADGSVAWNSVVVPTSGTLIFDNARSLTGAQSYQIATSATSSTGHVAWTTNITYATPMYASMCCYFTANPAAAFRLFEFATSAAAVKATLSCGSGGALQMFDSAGVGGGALTTLIPLNAWFRVEMKMIANSTTVGQLEHRLFLDPFGLTPTETKTTTATLNTSATATGELMFGHPVTATASQTHWFDEVQANDAGYPPPPPFQRNSFGLWTRQQAVVRAATL
jgi:hypothetical protein